MKTLVVTINHHSATNERKIQLIEAHSSGFSSSNLNATTEEAQAATKAFVIDEAGNEIKHEFDFVTRTDDTGTFSVLTFTKEG